jgi:hypothetical protein
MFKPKSTLLLAQLGVVVEHGDDYFEPRFPKFFGLHFISYLLCMSVYISVGKGIYTLCMIVYV